MKRMFAAGLLALPLLLAGGSSARAQCPSCSGGGGLPGYFFGTGHLAAGTGHCTGFCSRLFPHMHSHGPLVNYGPYQGYYPFEPYGPWTADLRYNAPVHPGHAGLFGDGGGTWFGGAFGKHGCGSCGGSKHDWSRYAKDTFRNVFHRCHPTGHKCGQSFGGCGTCSASAGKEVEANPVVQTSFPRSER